MNSITVLILWQVRQSLGVTPEEFAAAFEHIVDFMDPEQAERNLKFESAKFKEIGSTGASGRCAVKLPLLY